MLFPRERYILQGPLARDTHLFHKRRIPGGRADTKHERSFSCAFCSSTRALRCWTRGRAASTTINDLLSCDNSSLILRFLSRRRRSAPATNSFLLLSRYQEGYTPRKRHMTKNSQRAHYEEVALWNARMRCVTYLPSAKSWALFSSLSLSQHGYRLRKPDKSKNSKRIHYEAVRLCGAGLRCATYFGRIKLWSLCRQVAVGRCQEC